MVHKEDLYEDYGLDPNDQSEVVHLLLTTMCDALDDSKSMGDSFNEFAQTWSKFKAMPESEQKKCEGMLEDFQYMWGASAQSLIDDLILLCKLACLGDTSSFEKIRISCSNLSKSISDSDEHFWEDAPTLYNALRPIVNRVDIPRECQDQIHILIGKLKPLFMK